MNPLRAVTTSATAAWQSSSMAPNWAQCCASGTGRRWPIWGEGHTPGSWNHLSRITWSRQQVSSEDLMQTFARIQLLITSVLAPQTWTGHLYCLECQSQEACLVSHPLGFLICGLRGSPKPTAGTDCEVQVVTRMVCGWESSYKVAVLWHLRASYQLVSRFKMSVL